MISLNQHNDKATFPDLMVALHNISVVYQGIVTKTFLLIFLGLLLIGETLFQLLKFYVLYSPVFSPIGGKRKQKKFVLVF